MTQPKIPSYPIVHVTIQPDGSAHVNVAGQHVDYPAAAIEDTRARVIAYAATLADQLGRAVRMTTVDSDGEWTLGVYPDGAVVDLAPPTKGRAVAKSNAAPVLPHAPLIHQRVAQPLQPPAVPTAPIIRPTESLPIEATVLHLPPSSREPAVVAALTFSSGETAVLSLFAILGRRPTAGPDDPADVQLIVVHDPAREVSRVHCTLEWDGAHLIVVDRASGNGTYIIRDALTSDALEPGTPYELHAGDVLKLANTVTATVHLDASVAPGDLRAHR